MKRWMLLLAGLLVAGMGFGSMALYAASTRAHTFSGVVADPVTSAPDFTLTDETGQPFALSQLRGQWILLSYGYTSCPDVCPTTLAHLKSARELLGDEASKVTVVFVSVDPGRDTPEVLAEYVHHFNPDFKGLSGTPETVALAAKAFDVKYEKKPADANGNYLVGHSAFVYVIDPQFRLRLTYPFGVTAQEIAADLTYLFSQSEQFNSVDRAAVALPPQ